MKPLAWFAPITDALRHRNLRLYVIGNSVSLTGTWIQRIAVGWLTWELTESGAWLGLIAAADLFPSVLIGPFAGALADRVSRLAILRVGQALSMAQALALCLLAALDAMTIERLFALVLLNGMVIAVLQPARLAFVPSLVPRAQLPTAVAINSIVFNLARFLGPAIAGLLIVQLGVAAAFGANAVSFTAFGLALALIRLEPSPERARDLARPGLLADVLAGLRYTVSHPGIGPLLALVLAMAIAVRPYIELLPGFAAEVFAGGAGALAALGSAIGVGAIAGGIWVARGSAATRRASTVFACNAGAIVCVAGFAASSHFALALVFAALSGVCFAAGGVVTQSVVQLALEDSMRGRVMSLYGIIFRAGPAIGALAMGAASQWAGLQAPLLTGTLLAGATWLYLWLGRKRISHSLDSSRGSSVG